MIPVQIVQSNDAISLKLLNEIASNINRNGKLIYYDYGRIQNYHIYGSVEPPSYNLSKIQIPYYLIYGNNDQLATKDNVLRLYDDLPEKVKKHGYWAPNYEKFMHTDFLNAKDVRLLVYDHIVAFLNNV